MTNTGIIIYNSSGQIWQTGDAPLLSFGSFGEQIMIETYWQTSSPTPAITGNLMFDASLFIDAESTDLVNLHPNYGKYCRGYILDVTSLTNGVPTNMLYYGNDNTRLNGSVELEILNVGKTEFVFRHTFILSEDINDWMHSLNPSTLDNTDKLDSLGDFTTAYEVPKWYNVYCYNSATQFGVIGVELVFSKENEYNNSSPIFSDAFIEIYDGVTLVDNLIPNKNTTIEVNFTDGSGLVTDVDLLIANESQLTNTKVLQEDFDVYFATTSTITVVSGSNKKATFIVPSGTFNHNDNYKVTTTIIGGNKTTSFKVTNQAKFIFSECLPFININWKHYTGTKTSSKIEIAPYERMRFEFIVFHDKESAISTSYLDCVTNQILYLPSFIDGFQSLSVDLLGNTYLFTKQGNNIIAPFGWEHNIVDFGGYNASVFSFEFRAQDGLEGANYVGNVALLMNYGIYGIVNNTVQLVDVVAHTINQPILVDVLDYDNASGSPLITSLVSRNSDGSLANVTYCKDTDYLLVRAESGTNFEPQAILFSGFSPQEEDASVSVQSEAFFNQLTTPLIYDLDADFTGGDCTFKIDVTQSPITTNVFSRIIVIGCL